MTSVTWKIGEKKMTSSLVRTTMMLCTDPIKDQLEKKVVKLLDNLKLIESTKGILNITFLAKLFFKIQITTYTTLV